MKKRLSEVSSFGAIDADADELLRECFQDHQAYLDVRRLERFLVLGRKGSGKTAIFKRLITEKAPTYFAYGHSFDDYPWHHHDLQAQLGVPEERRYIHSWKYLILLSLGKILINQDQSQPWTDAARDSLYALEQFIVDSYGSRDPDLAQLFTPDRELKFKGTLRIPFLEVSGERLRVKDLPVHVQEVNRAIQDHVIGALNPRNTYFICFDQLDLGFAKSEPRYEQRLTGLILAARDLFLASRDAGRSMNVAVFLRDDIYQDLQFEDKNKVTENFAAEVRWTEAPGALSLKQLMEKRFAQALLGHSDKTVAWEEVFDETKEMPSRQSKYRHICDRTFLRPRDMIKFCNEVLRSFKDSQGDHDIFDNAAIHGARDRYSDYLLNELDDEIAKHVPEYKEYLEVIKALGSEKFMRDNFARQWANRFPDRAAEAPAALQHLFEFSVIGYLKPGGRGGGSEYVWRYRDPRARFDPTAETLRVHPGFKEALDLTRSG